MTWNSSGLRRRMPAGGALLATALSLFVAPLVASPRAPQAASSSQADALADGFRNPPHAARLRCYWWWLNGNTTKDAITRDLEAMRAKGFGGAIIVDAGGAEQRGHVQVPAGPRFASEEWRALYRHALKEAQRLGLELSLNILSGWNLGGPGVEPQDAAKLAVWSRTVVRGPVTIAQKLPRPNAPIGYYRDVAVLAYPLHHGAKPQRAPVRQLALKAAAHEFGMSTPDTRSLVTDVVATPGEQDATRAEVRNISDNMTSDGTLRWTVPEGEWEILRFGYAASGAQVSTSSQTWTGLAIDYLDHEALDKYFARHVEPLMEDARPYLGSTLKYLVTDSWELGGTNWTSRFAQEFQTRRGYSALPWVPVLAGRIIESREASNRFLNDLRRTVGDLVADEHYAHFEKLAARYNLGIHPESGGPHGAPIDALRNLGIGAFPQMEFWARAKTHRTTEEERFFVKEGASAAHIYGKTLVGAEGFTSIGPQWEETLWDNLKPTFDKAICEGLNLLIWHTFTSSPTSMGKPGQEYFAGSHFNPNITWWPMAEGFTSYLNRTTYLMQQGLFVADALYYYGDQVPNFVRLKTTDPARVLPGYDYDGLDLNALLTRVSVRDGRLVLPDGMSYSVLVLSDVETIAPSALAKIAALVRNGATVVGRRPLRASTLETNEAQFTATLNELWGDASAPTCERRVGQGRVVWGRATREVLADARIAPDFDARAVALDYIHRRVDDVDIYFVSNQHAARQRFDATFRVAGKTPELWNPITGERRTLALYRETADGRTSVPLDLEPYGSTFVVFRASAAPHYVAKSVTAPVELSQRGSGLVLSGSFTGAVTLTDQRGATTTVNVPTTPAPVVVGGPWRVHFAEGWGAPASINFPKLISWTEHTDASIRYFSGIARYETEFTLPASMLDARNALELNLGEVREMARVRLNGRDLGVVWAMPRVIDITGAAHAGANRLEIEVANLWPNRLIGDQQLPESQRRTRTNIRKFTAASPLLPSGLLGPVTVRAVPSVDVPMPR